MRRNMTCLLAVLFSGPALGQFDATYLLVSSNTVTPTTPITTIEIWATFEDPLFEWVFGFGDYDLTAGDGVFSNPVNVLNASGSTTGVIAGNVISGAVLGQFHIPGAGLIGSRDNPILLATYEWTTTLFTPRTVSLHTSNTANFWVIWWLHRNPDPPGPINMYSSRFTSGSGVINVVPAPAAWVVLALPLVASTRRRRS
ncbi:MAG: hypothetical protein IH985_01000 [Planctomycetes bacterium]|nr:hypothetical protein [Planctomycetota bacterium]